MAVGKRRGQGEGLLCRDSCFALRECTGVHQVSRWAGESTEGIAEYVQHRN